LDLSAYLARIGYTGPVAPTLQTLNGIVESHVRAIPFENLDVLLGRPIVLAPEVLERKLVAARRGGYCFEQNGLLLAVLAEIGFSVKPLSARVRVDRPRGVIPPRTHLFVRVEIEGEPWLADVGVGALSLTSAIRLQVDDTQPTPHEPRRIVREGELWVHQVRLGFDWQDVCEFTLEEMPFVDRELANWYTSTHPESRFRQRLVAARALPDGERLTLVNREVTRRARSGRADTRVLQSHDELLDVLGEEFGLRFDRDVRFACPGIDWGD
jgi:N-hydroxyarylamine O-acetyltransferase